VPLFINNQGEIDITELMSKTYCCLSAGVTVAESRLISLVATNLGTVDNRFAYAEVSKLCLQVPRLGLRSKNPWRRMTLASTFGISAYNTPESEAFESAHVEYVEYCSIWNTSIGRPGDT